MYLVSFLLQRYCQCRLKHILGLAGQTPMPITFECIRLCNVGKMLKLKLLLVLETQGQMELKFKPFPGGA